MVKIILGNPVYSMGKRFIVKNKDYETDQKKNKNETTMTKTAANVYSEYC